jgi:hypothetical protein
VAREHLNADVTPQLQKESSEKGPSPTAGGAYGSRDDPKAQASQPTEGKSQKQIVQVSGELWLLQSTCPSARRLDGAVVMWLRA